MIANVGEHALRGRKAVNRSLTSDRDDGLGDFDVSGQFIVSITHEFSTDW